jgi:hypothetical protein
LYAKLSRGDIRKGTREGAGSRTKNVVLTVIFAKIFAPDPSVLRRDTIRLESEWLSKRARCMKLEIEACRLLMTSPLRHHGPRHDSRGAFP